MNSSVWVPGSGVNASTKDAVISLLSTRYPLSAKEIASALKREYGSNASYAAVHKAVNELLKSNVLERAGLKYRLAPDWISRVKNFADVVDRLYAGKGNAFDFGKTDIVNFRFVNFVEMGKFIINEFYLKFPNPDHKADLSFNEHAWLLIGGGDREFDALKEICARSGIYNITRNDTVLDRAAVGFLEKLGKKCLVGVKPPMEGDVYIVGDFLAQVYFPSDFKEKFFALYETVQDFSKLDLPAYFQLISSPALITVTISKNPELADLLRKEAKQVFESHGVKW